MNKITSFFTTLFKSCTNPAYYSHIITAPLSFAIKYTALLYFFITLVALSPAFQGLFVFDLAPAIRSVAQYYPSDLELTLTNGQFFINKPLPYTIPLPTEWSEGLKNSEATAPAALIVFESDANIQGIDDVRAREALAVITESTAYLLSDQDTGQMRVYPIPRTEGTLRLSRSVIDSVLVKVTEMPIIKSRLYAPILSLALLIIVYPFMFAGSLLAMLFFALIAYLLAAVFFKQKQLTYGALYKMGLLAQTPLVLINTGTERFAGYTLIPGLLYLVVFIGWMMFLVANIKSTVKKRRS